MIYIDQKKCIACGACVNDCVSSNIEIVSNKANAIRQYCLLCGHCIAICPKKAVTMDDYPMADVKEYEKDEFSIEPEKLLNFIKIRRSIRQFTKESIDEDKLLKIIEAGRFTPTGSNRQDIKYIVVRDQIPELRRLALERLSESMLQQAQVDSAYAAIASRWTNMLEADKDRPGKSDALFYNAPVVLLLVSYSPVDAALAASNMELMAAALGLGVLYCGYFVRAAQEDEKIKNLLGLNEMQEIKVCLLLGNPNVTYERTVPRKPANIDWR